MKYSAEYHVLPLHFMLYRGKSITFGTVWIYNPQQVTSLYTLGGIEPPEGSPK